MSTSSIRTAPRSSQWGASDWAASDAYARQCRNQHDEAVARWEDDGGPTYETTIEHTEATR